MKFAATLFFAAVAVALEPVTDGSKPFGLMSLRTGTNVHLQAVGISGDALVIDRTGASYVIKDGVLYVNDKPLDFSSGEAKIAADGKGTTGVTLSEGYVTVPGFSWTGCPATGEAYNFLVDANCAADGTPFGAWALPKEDDAPATSAAVPTTAVVAPSSAPVVAPSSAPAAIVTQIGDGQIQAPPSSVPEQANGAVSYGVSAAALGVAAAALLI